MTTRLRLMYLLPFAPRLDAPHGGARVLRQLLMRLAERHDVALLCMRTADEPPADAELRARCALIEEFPRAQPSAGMLAIGGWRRRAGLLRAWAHGQPMQVADWHSSALQRRVSQLASTWKPDVVQIEYPVMGQYLAALSRCPAPRVLTEHDPGTAAARERASAASGLQRPIHWIDASLWERYELSIIPLVQAVVVFTDRDRRALAPLAAATPIVAIPLGADLPAQALDPYGSSPPQLLFIGNFMHTPNVGAAMRLASAIFPRVRASCPDLMLSIVGDQPPPALRQAADDHIVVTGRVPDVTPYLDQAALVVAPLHTGGGMRVKVLEALAAGKAVVASPLAVAGLHLIDREHVRIAETDAEFVSAILELLAAPERRAAMAARARAWACEQLSWDGAVAGYESLYQNLIAAQDRRAAVTPTGLGSTVPDRGAR